MALVRLFAYVLGAIYVVIGILGFLNPFVTGIANGPIVLGVGQLFGIFAINWLHNLVHLLVGVFGLWAGRALDSSRLFSQVVGWAFLALFVVGLLSPALLVLGILPLDTADNVLHLITGVVALFLGYAPMRVAAQPTAVGAPERRTHI